MTDKQPEALRLAEIADYRDYPTDRLIADELRRLYAENERLRSAANRGGHVAAAWELQQADEALLRQALEALRLKYSDEIYASNPDAAAQFEDDITALSTAPPLRLEGI